MRKSIMQFAALKYNYTELYWNYTDYATILPDFALIIPDYASIISDYTIEIIFPGIIPNITDIITEGG